MEGLPENYRDNITVDNGVEIVWVDEKGQAIAPEAAAGANDCEKKPSKDAAPPVVSAEAGTPRVVTSPPASAGTPAIAGTPATAVIATPERSKRKSISGTVSAPDLIGTWFTTAPEGESLD